MSETTVLVTGATGYIGKHLVLQLLNAGYAVVGSVRDTNREAELRDAVAPGLTDPGFLDNLRVVPLDLTSDEGWDAAMTGVDVLMHTASPFPLKQPKDENDLIRPAVDGALRAVRAAKQAGITRVIMTSSTVAVMNADLPPGKDIYDEQDWTDLNHPSSTAYVKSKTLAEQAVWDWQNTDGPEMQITMINPSFVQGPPLDRHYGSSVNVIERLVTSKDPMLAAFGMPCVDVRDIALMHIRAMERPESIGKRFIGVDRTLWYQDMAQILKSAFPERKIVTRVAPNFVVRFLALFDATVRSILPILGHCPRVSNTQARDILGIQFRDVRASIREAGEFLVENKLV
ncbi:MAG: NAD-dependent epimerase/dehydratase family protein [Rhodobacteraceae bacterium]|nr:NAD-dependent epimerase/dehydratase family protein [Paracoccaceae bacterium]